MNKDFIRNITFLIFVNVVVKPIWIFGIDRSVQNMVGAEVYGNYFALFNFAFLFHIFLDAGISSFNSKTIAENKSLLYSYLPKIVQIKLVLAIIYIVLCFGGAYLLNFDSQQFGLLILLGGNQILMSFLLFLRSNLQALHLFKTDGWLSILDRLLMICFCSLLFVVLGNFQIHTFVLIQTVGYFLTVVTGVFLVYEEWKKAVPTKQELKNNIVTEGDESLWYAIFRQSYPYALLILLMTIYNRIDVIMLKKLLPVPLGNEEAGIYAASYRLLDAVNMIGVLFSTILLPMFSRQIAQKEWRNLTTLVQFSSKILLVVAWTTAICCFFFRYNIMELLYVDANDYYALIFGYLMFSFLLISQMYVYGSLLTAGGHLRYLNGMAVIGVIANICLNYMLIADYQAFGATIATLITQFLTVGGQIIFAIYLFKVTIHIKTIVKIMVYMPTCFILTHYLAHLPFSWIINMLMSLLVCGGLSLLFGIVKIRWKLF